MYVSRSRTSCVGHHLTDPALSMMPHQRLKTGGGNLVRGARDSVSYQWQLHTTPARPAELGLSVIKHKSLNGCLSSWPPHSRIRAGRSKNYLHVRRYRLQSKFFFFFIGKKKRKDSVKEAEIYEDRVIDNRKVVRWFAIRNMPAKRLCFFFFNFI